MCTLIETIMSTSIYFYVYRCFSCLHVCAPYVCLVPKEAKRVYYRQLWTAMWVLGIESRSSERIVHALAAEPSLQPLLPITIHLFYHSIHFPNGGDKQAWILNFVLHEENITGFFCLPCPKTLSSASLSSIHPSQRHQTVKQLHVIASCHCPTA